MLVAVVNGVEIRSKSLSGLKRQASIIANNRFSAIDTFVLFERDGVRLKDCITYSRFNKKSPDGSMVRGVWK